MKYCHTICMTTPPSYQRESRRDSEHSEGDVGRYADVGILVAEVGGEQGQRPREQGVACGAEALLEAYVRGHEVGEQPETGGEAGRAHGERRVQTMG